MCGGFGSPFPFPLGVLVCAGMPLTPIAFLRLPLVQGDAPLAGLNRKRCWLRIATEGITPARLRGLRDQGFRRSTPRG